DEARRYVVAVLKLDGCLEGDHVLLPRQREEVAHAMQVDVPSRPVPEPAEQLERSHPEDDIELVAELRADASGGSTRRPPAERATVEHEHALRAGLGKMEGNGQPHHPTADDHDGSALRQVRHRRKAGSYGSSITSI